MSHTIVNLLGYGTSHLGKSLLWSFFNTFFLFYAVYALKLSPLEAGLLLFAFALTDAVFDFPAALLIHRFRKSKSLAFWVNLATPVSAVILVLVFGSAALFEVQSSFVYCAIVGVLFRLAFTFLDIPLNASIGRIEICTSKRNYIAASRSIASTCAKVLIATTVHLFAENDEAIVPSELWFVALLVAILSVVSVVPCFTMIDKHARKQDMRFEQGSTKLPNSSLTQLTSKNMHCLYLLNFFLLVMISQFANILIFLINENPDYSLSFASVWQLMSVVSAFTVILWSILARNIGKKKASITGLIALSVLMPIYFTMNDSEFGIVIFVLLFSSVNHVNTHVWSMLPDAADQISQQVNKNMQVLVIGWFAATGKVMIGLGSLLSAYFLELSGFPQQANIEVLENYVVTIVFLGVIGALVSVFIYRE